MLGIPERRYDILTKKRLQQEDLLVFDGLWTSPLKTLLSLRETNHDLKNVYNTTLRAMTRIVSGADYLSNTPLDRWTLACKSAKFGEIEFADYLYLGEQSEDLDLGEPRSSFIFTIKCEEVENGRMKKN